MSNPYKEEPLNVKDEIPLFIKPDIYTENYEEISKIHLANDGVNPFIDSVQWEEMEKIHPRSNKEILQN